MKDSIFIIPIFPDLLDAVWDDVVSLMEPSVKRSRGKFDISDVRDGIDKGVLVLWAVMDANKPVAFYTTRIVEYPRCRAMAMDWVGGKNIRSWMHKALDQMEEHARSNGCQHLEGFGRKGWGRLLRHRGWEPEYIAYRMDLNNGHGQGRE